jgi:hypothetical protein
MLDFVVQELGTCTAWRKLLEAYQSRQIELKKSQPDADSWIPRLSGIEGVEPADLSKLHGKLIALGLLKFEMSGRHEGVQYQVSTLGRQSLELGLPAEAVEDQPLAEADGVSERAA